MIARWIAAVVGVFYLGAGLWSFLAPTAFYSNVASFAPYNLHLLHDVGAFQIGLGGALIAGALVARALLPALVGALAGSVFHLLAHVLDVRLGGHPAIDLPALSVLALAIAVALYLEVARPGRDTTR